MTQSGLRDMDALLLVAMVMWPPFNPAQEKFGPLNV
jgi:hypothetical protein